MGDDMSDGQTTDSGPATSTKKTGPGLDALVEDVLGLNIRGLKTIWYLLKSPAEVFTAACDENWEDRFTPSIRLYFSIIAVLIFFQFIWAGEQSYTHEAFRMQFEQMRSMPNFGNIDVESATDLAVDTYLLVSPIVIGICLILTACCIFIWGKGTNLVTRIRLFFAALIPNTAFSLLLTMAGSFATVQQTMAIASVTFASMLIINGITVYRGLRPVHDNAARIWRSLLFAFITMIAVAFAGMVSQLIVGVWAGLQIANL